jgi:molybdate/tungstate transport system substrate-binding protein
VKVRVALPALLLALALAGCGSEEETAASKPRPKPKDLRVFHAAGLSPVLSAVRTECEEKLGIRLRPEASGSQVACRKLAELGRDCDLVMLADAGLVSELLGGVCSWRLDFAGDEVVLAVGARAPQTDRARTNWPAVLLSKGVRIARVDENQGPIGYRALMVWKLQEKLGPAGLHDRLMARCDKVVDHVTRLTPLLKTGEVDYAFAYRSICMAHDVRYFRLDPRVNLGSVDADYSAAKVSYRRKSSGKERVTVGGAPITWALSIPDRRADAETARRFVTWLLKEKSDLLARHGFRPLTPPRFYGEEKSFAPFAKVAERRGRLASGGSP